jgi:heptosyltransferase-1
MNILVVKLSAFGDIIHALPALDDLLARPEVGAVHWLVDARYRFVTEAFPPSVIVHTVAMKGERPLRAAWQAVKCLRRHRFDAVLDLQGLIKSALLARAAGSPVYGIDPAQLRERPAGWLQRPARFHAEDRHVVQQYRRVAAAPFAPDPGHRPHAPMPYSPPRVRPGVMEALADPTTMAGLGLDGQRYVVLHSAGGWATKRLPDATWIAIARGALARGLTPVFSWGSDAERRIAADLAAQGGGLALSARLNMSALTTLLAKAEAVVGADTGVLHLAAALGTPTITCWGPSASWRSAPIGERHWHIESNPACGPCFKRHCDAFVCMPSIRADAVLEAIDERLAH